MQKKVAHTVIFLKLGGTNGAQNATKFNVF